MRTLTKEEATLGVITLAISVHGATVRERAQRLSKVRGLRPPPFAVLEPARNVPGAGLLRAAPFFLSEAPPASGKLEARGRDHRRLACVSNGRLRNEPRRYNGLSGKTIYTAEELRK